ncbi:MAG: BTAD domain-containing putative transcriptional regulator [Nitrospiraceae bacterium]|nr:BTAD domain-containing putative transcriptional regulator [Nitrospiraceae bacterium]
MKRVAAPSAKITRPAVSGVFPREKLFSRLDSMRDFPALWVSSPAGSGKTTLTASWLESRKIPHLWYLVDQTDTDPASFFYYMGLAARKLGRYRKALPLFTAEYFQGLPAFTAWYFEEMYRRLKPPHILVFDNCQDVHEDAPFWEIMAQAIPLIPAGIQCILISRHEPPPRMVHFLANRNMAPLGWQEIRFTLEETKTFLDVQGRKRIPRDALREIQEKTNGWAAGLVLLLEEMKMAGPALVPLAALNQERVFDYFASEVLSKMDGMTREFLLKASFLPRIPADSARQITGFDAAEKILSELNRKNYFVERRNADVSFYRMHPLFKEFLNARAVEEYPKEEISALRKMAAVLLMEVGQTENAAELWIQCGDWESLSALIMKNAGRFVNQGRTRTLEGWISKIPEKSLESSPWLLYWLGMCRMGNDPARARGHFEKAYWQFTAGDDLAGALLSWCFIVDGFAYEWNDFSSMRSWIDRLYALIEKNGSHFPFAGIEDRINAKVAACMTYAIVSCRPAHPDAETWAERCLTLSRDCGDPACRLQALGYAFYFHGFRGENSKLILLAGELLAAAGSPDVPPFLKIFSMLLHTPLNVFIAPDPEKALAEIDAMRETADRTGIRIMGGDQSMIGAMAALIAGDFARADGFLHEKTWVCFRPRIGFCQFLHVSGHREFLAGNLAEAEVYAEAAREIEKTGFVYAIALCYYELAQVKHALGKFEEARKCIRSCEELSAGSDVLKFMCLLAKAQFSFDTCEETVALEYLREGFRLGRKHNYMGFIWWWDAHAMARLAARALEAGIEPEYTRRLVHRRGLAKYACPVEVEGWPWPVKVYTFGEFRVVRDGRALEFKGKARQKPLTLLKVLIALNHQDIPEARITDMLWPDAEGDLAHKSYEINLVRLRKLIGEKAVRVSGGLCSLDEKYCWTDLKAISRIMEQAENELKTAGEAGGAGTALDLTEKAIALYKGDFLPSELWLGWAIMMREKVKSRLLRLIMDLGKHLMRNGQLEAAVQKFEKGLELDNIIEELYQNLMYCEIGLGRRAETARAYERCRRTLFETLGLKPSVVTEKIYKSIF